MFEKHYQAMVAAKPKAMKYLQETLDLEPVQDIVKG